MKPDNETINKIINQSMLETIAYDILGAGGFGKSNPVFEQMCPQEIIERMNKRLYAVALQYGAILDDDFYEYAQFFHSIVIEYYTRHLKFINAVNEDLEKYQRGANTGRKLYIDFEKLNGANT